MNVNVDTKGLGDILKHLPYKFVLSLVTVLSALLIFLPDSALAKLFLLELRNRIGPFLGIIFIVSACLFVFLFLSPIVSDYRIKKALSGKTARRKFDSLSIVEKQIIVYMYRHRTSHIVLPSTNSAVLHLKNQLMITEANNLGTCLGTVQFFSYFLQQWVVVLLDENPQLISEIPPKLPEEFERYMQLISI